MLFRSGVDVLVECAGISHRLNFLDLDIDTWDRIIAVNLTGMFHLGQAAARQMVKQGGGGSIINVTSQLAEVARSERAAYVAPWGGGQSLTQAMALELAAHGIRVNAIAPRPTLTGLTRQLRGSREAARRLRKSPSGTQTHRTPHRLTRNRKELSPNFGDGLRVRRRLWFETRQNCR